MSARGLSAAPDWWVAHFPEEARAAEWMHKRKLFVLVALVFKVMHVRGHFELARLLVEYLAEMSVECWSDGKVQRHVGMHNEPVRSLSLSQQEDKLASGDEAGWVKLWNLKSGTLVSEVRAHAAWMRSLAFSANGNTLLSGSDDGLVKMWEVPTLRLVGEMGAHSSCVNSVAFVRGDKQVLSASDDETAILSDATTGFSVVRVFNHLHRVYALAVGLGDHGSFCTGSEDGMIYLWQLETDGPVRQWSAHAGWVWVICYSALHDSSIIFSGSEDKMIKSWNVNEGMLLREFTAHLSNVLSLCMLGPKLVGSCSKDGTWQVWNQEDKSANFSWDCELNCLVFAKGAGKVLTGDGLGHVVEWGI